MPSKGGSRESGGAVPLAQALAAAMPAATATAAPVSNQPLNLQDERRPLQQGAEVARFNELVERQHDLTADESDELYRYRVRRLQTAARALERAMYLPEEQLRTALDRYRRRLEALRAFEQLRTQAGLPGAFEADPAVAERATARLVQMAENRPHGLIAGSGETPELPSGNARIAAVQFARSPDDAPIYILAPQSQPSEALSRSVEAIAADGGSVHLVHSAAEIPRDNPMPLVLNWGSSEPLPRDVICLNSPEAVRVASDQVESLRRLGELAPRTVVHPGDLHLLGSARAVAKRRRGSQGRGKAVIASDGPTADRAGFDLYQEFLPARREWRVSMLSGRVVSAYLKQPPAGTAPDDLRPEWLHSRTDVVPRGVVQVAREAAARVGLDYAGIDVVEDLQGGRVLCLEANAAPGMSQETLRNLYAQVQQALRGRRREAV